MTPKNIVLIVGSGAVENAWLPIFKSFQNVSKWPVMDADGANFSFTRLIFLLRFYSSTKFTEKTQGLDSTKAIVKQLKYEISKQLKIAQENDELKTRSHFEKLLANFIFSDDNNFCVISTNWDTVIDNAINKFWSKIDSGKSIKTFHVHGSINDPDHLYLPSEITCENYRSKEEDEKHGVNHDLLVKLLQKANQVILYGISLDPLDAELNQTLLAGLKTDNLKEITVINPDFNKVANRVELLLAELSKEIKITRYNPSRYDN